MQMVFKSRETSSRLGDYKTSMLLSEGYVFFVLTSMHVSRIRISIIHFINIEGKYIFDLSSMLRMCFLDWQNYEQK